MSLVGFVWIFPVIGNGLDWIGVLVYTRAKEGSGIMMKNLIRKHSIQEN
jgi:hypothetical protein